MVIKASNYVDASPEHERLKSAMNYIMLLAHKKDVHLGRPRLSDKSCIACMAYFALNNGDYKETASKEDYDKWSEELIGGK